MLYSIRLLRLLSTEEARRYARGGAGGERQSLASVTPMSSEALGGSPVVGGVTLRPCSIKDSVIWSSMDAAPLPRRFPSCICTAPRFKAQRSSMPSGSEGCFLGTSAKRSLAKSHFFVCGTTRKPTSRFSESGVGLATATRAALSCASTPRTVLVVGCSIAGPMDFMRGCPLPTLCSIAVHLQRPSRPRPRCRWPVVGTLCGPNLCLRALRRQCSNPTKSQIFRQMMCFFPQERSIVRASSQRRAPLQDTIPYFQCPALKPL